MTIPLLISVIALAVAWREIRYLNAQSAARLSDKIDSENRLNAANIRVIVLQTKNDSLWVMVADIAEKHAAQIKANDALRAELEFRTTSITKTIELQKAELRRKHRKVVA